MCLIEDFKTFVEQNISAEIIKLKNKEAAETIFLLPREILSIKNEKQRGFVSKITTNKFHQIFPVN